MPFVVIGLVVAVVVEGILIALALRNGKRARFIAETPTCKVRELAPGPAKLTGQAVALADTLEAPLSGRPCVYYRFVVQEKRTQSHGPHGASTHWKTVIDDAHNAPCGVEDETGIAAVALREASLLLDPDAETRSGFLNDPPPELEQMLRERYNRSTVGWVFNKGMKYIETRIEVGDELFVLGTVETTPGGNACFVKGDDLFLISDKTEERLLSRYRGYALLCWVLAGLVGLGAVVALGAILA